jgi:hypothetical protein
MSFTNASTTQMIPLSVFGTAYVPERHSESFGSFAEVAEADPLETGISSLWGSFFAAIRISLIGSSQTVH